MSGTATHTELLRPAVFLDRDGVLNDVRVRDDGTPVAPSNAVEFSLLPGVVTACRRLRELGYVLVVVTNQPDIARGSQSRDEVERMHDLLREQIAVDDIVVCPHDDADDCACRKPRPGMLLDAARRLHLDLSRSFCVGDRWRDVEAARQAGIPGIYIDRDYGERKAVGAHAVVTSLPDAVMFIESRELQRRSING